MNNNTPQTLKGFRDFLPTEKRKRDFLASKLTQVFALYGFEPLETPTLEYASLLLGKYGDEADKLVYTFTDRGGREIGLRYDQTVPTARVLAQYQHQLPKYFRRYQIQNTFRSEKPQAGRYREFTQCDLDIFGSSDPLADAEILAAVYASYKSIGFDQIIIKINDRQILFDALSPFSSASISVFSLIQTVDKLDKLSLESVQAELISKGLTSEQASQALDLITSTPKPKSLQAITNNAVSLGVPDTSLQFSPTLARGLDYYTGLIIEVQIPQFTSGSVGGGGRYDKLIEDLSGVSLPAVGFAFGFDRTLEAADTLGLIPSATNTTQVLVSIFSDQTLSQSLDIATSLRQAGISTEVYPALDKLSKQVKLANQKSIPWVVIIGDTEQASNQITLKNMNSGDQQTLSLDQAIQLIQS